MSEDPGQVSSSGGEGQLTCVACRLVFPNAILQRDHYRSEWHRYNLQRRVIDLPPVTNEEFQAKAQMANQAQAQKDRTRSKTLGAEIKCDPCNKVFKRQETFENHIKSKRHLDIVASVGEKVSDQPVKVNQTTVEEEVVEESEENWEDMDDGDEEEWDNDGSISTDQCLFCSETTSNSEKALLHMAKAHGFFIPDMDYCIDAEGLMTYLGLKVGSGLVCLLCNERSRNFRNLDALQKHMRDKEHCKLPNDAASMLELEDFYDYRTSYPVKDGETEPNPGEELPTATIEAGWELMLPSGATIGHRSLARYYRQKLRPRVGVHKVDSDRTTRSKIMTNYKALGWTGLSGEAAKRKYKDMKFMKQHMDKKLLKKQVKANKLQSHFKSDVAF